MLTASILSRNIRRNEFSKTDQLCALHMTKKAWLNLIRSIKILVKLCPTFHEYFRLSKTYLPMKFSRANTAEFAAGKTWRSPPLCSVSTIFMRITFQLSTNYITFDVCIFIICIIKKSKHIKLPRCNYYYWQVACRICGLWIRMRFRYHQSKILLVYWWINLDNFHEQSAKKN